MIEPYYQSDRVKLFHGDCLEILPMLSGVDAVITSPPYNCGKDYGATSDTMDATVYWGWLETVLQAATKTLDPHGFLCVNHGNFIGSRDGREFVADELCPIMSRCLPFVDWIIWDKGPANGAAWGNFRTAPRIRAQHENVWIHGGVVQMPPSDIDWPEWSQLTTSIWRVGTAGVDASLHPAMMPVEVARRLCVLYTPKNGMALDPFTGSGTTAVAAIRTGRSFVGCEIDKGYCAIAKRRIQEAEQAFALFEPATPEKQAEMF